MDMTGAGDRALLDVLCQTADAVWEIDLPQQTVQVWQELDERQKPCVQLPLEQALQRAESRVSPVDRPRWRAVWTQIRDREDPATGGGAELHFLRGTAQCGGTVQWRRCAEGHVWLTARCRAPEADSRLEDEWLCHHFGAMPLPAGVVKVLFDREGQPADLLFCRVNLALCQLLGQKETRQLEHRPLLEVLPEADLLWLRMCHRANTTKRPQHSVRYSQLLHRYLEIWTYPLDGERCGCVLQDVTREVEQEGQLKESWQRQALLLKNTTDAVFQYDLARRTLFMSEGAAQWCRPLPTVPDMPWGLLERGMIQQAGAEALRQVIGHLEAGGESAGCDILARLAPDETFGWYNVTFWRYRDRNSGSWQVMGSFKNIHQEVLRREQLERAAAQDPLTGVYNVATGRRLVKQQLKQHPGGNGRYNALFIIDLDDFKGINDSCGHHTGDAVLQEFVCALQRAFRSGDIVYRLGSDEFAAFIGDLQRPYRVVDRVSRRLLNDLSREDRCGVPVRASIGVFIGGGPLTYEQYYKNADRALYAAKERGKNRVVVVEDNLF